MKIFPGLIFKHINIQHQKLQVVVSIMDSERFIKAPILMRGKKIFIGLVSEADVSEIGTVVGFIPENEITHSLNRFRKNIEGK